MSLAEINDLDSYMQAMGSTLAKQTIARLAPLHAPGRDAPQVPVHAHRPDRCRLPGR
jgi:hypothetical protein